MDEAYDSSIGLVGDVEVVRVTGVVGISTSPRFRRDLEVAMDAPGPGVVVELSGVELADSTAYAVLALAAERMLRERRRLVLVVRGKRALRGFKLLGLRRLFAIVPSVAEATAVVASPPPLRAAA
jgi:anti-sigma B factor antagonist